MTLLDDIALIRQFVKGETTLAANQNLRVESAFNALQLLVKRRGVIATAQLNDGKVRAILARAESEYWGLLHQVAQEHGLMPADVQDQAGWMKYEGRPIPEGYQVNYTESRLLWKEWWVRSRQSPNRAIQLNLLIFVAKRQQWYPIREIICHEGTLYIKTLVAELVLLANDSVVWLNQMVPAGNAAPSEPSAPPQPAHSESRPAQLPRNHLASRTTAEPEGDRAQPVSPPAFDQNAWAKATTASVSSAVAASPRSPAGTPTHPSATATTAKLRGVVRVSQNRLYIQTAVGEVVVEGANMRFWLNGSTSEIHSKMT
ncbi:MAG TPA: hypothetical protein V6C63_11105 [Allocoleopsis sp.]